MKTLLFIGLIFLPSIAFSQQIVLKSDVIADGKLYHITLEKYNGKVFIWARKVLNQSNMGDIQIFEVETKKVPKKDEAMKFICRAQKTIDDGRFVLGCASVVGTGVCVATGGGAGVGLPICVATAGYAATTGLVDCVAGLTDKIGSYFGYSDFGYAAEQAFGALSPTSLVSNAIEEACDDWKANK